MSNSQRLENALPAKIRSPESKDNVLDSRLRGNDNKGKAILPTEQPEPGAFTGPSFPFPGCRKDGNGSKFTETEWKATPKYEKATMIKIGRALAAKRIWIWASVLATVLLPPFSHEGASSEKAPVFVDASSNNFPPMNFLDKESRLTGFGRDLADAVMRAVGAKVRHIHSPHWVQVLEWLDSGEADFIHDTGYTEDRDAFLDYSKPVIEMPEMIFVRSDQYDIVDLESLKNKKVACVNKHISHLYLKELPGIDCYLVKTPVEGMYELVSRKVDAFVYPKQIVLYLAQNLRLTDKIKSVGEPLRNLTWSMVVKQDNRKMLEIINRGIDKVKSTGEYEKIYEKWWGKKVLAGYSKGELRVFISIAVGVSTIFLSLVALFLHNRRLRAGKIRLEQEILERKRAEDKIAAALKEKEVLLREVHHRVKNNMQVIVSLLRLYSSKVEDSRSKEVFEDCRARVGAMSLVHEALYRSDDLGRIDLEDYLRKLCLALGRTHSQTVSLVSKDCRVSLGMDQAIAAGMVVGELVGNAFKHAFPGREAGTVSVELNCMDGTEVELAVRDDGVGLPADLDVFKSPSMGLQLVVATVEHQLKGRLEAKSNGGTTILVRFRCKDNGSDLPTRSSSPADRKPSLETR